MNPLDPLGPLRLGFAALSAILWKGLEGPTKFLRSNTESMGLLDAVFGEAWGLGGLVATNMLFGIIAVMALGRMKLVENLPYALAGVALTNGLGGIVVWNLHHELLQVAPATMQTIMPPETLAAGRIAAPFFPPAEDGLPAVGLYVIYWAITLLLVLVKGVAWAGRDLAPGLLLVAFSIWGFTGVGRSFVRWSAMFYACCILLFDLVVALVVTASYRTSQNLKREDLRIVAAIAVVVVIVAAFWAFLVCYQQISTSSVGGWLRSRVKGHTKSDVQNEPNVRTRDQEPTIVPTTIPVEVTTHNPAPSVTDRDLTVSITDNSLVAGGLILGKAQVATPTQPAENPQQTMEHYRRQAGWTS